MTGGEAFAAVIAGIAIDELIRWADFIRRNAPEALSDTDSDCRTAALANDVLELPERTSLGTNDVAGGSGSHERHRGSIGGTQQRDASTQHPRCGGL